MIYFYPVLYNHSSGYTAGAVANNTTDQAKNVVVEVKDKFGHVVDRQITFIQPGRIENLGIFVVENGPISAEITVDSGVFVIMSQITPVSHVVVPPVMLE